MLGGETDLQQYFQWYKGVGIASALAMVVLFQLLFPNRLAIADLLRNWKVNAPMALINVGLTSLLCGACVCTWAVMVREKHFGLFVYWDVPIWLQIALTVLILDWVAWIWHRANHRNGFLWRFHAVHHSDRRFEASTAFRFHPGELLISLSIRLLVVTMTALPITGLILFEVVYGFCNIFVHSDIRMPRKWESGLGLLVITPSMHRVHHSERKTEHHRNFGTILSLWDRLARTYHGADATTPVPVGLAYLGPVDLPEALALPFRRPSGEEEVTPAQLDG